MSDKSESKPRELWVNIYDNANRVYDCVGHLSLEKCAKEVAIYVKEQCVHFIEFKAYESLQSQLADYKYLHESIAAKVFPGENDSVDAMIEIVKERDKLKSQLSAAQAEIKRLSDYNGMRGRALDSLSKELDAKDEVIKILREGLECLVKALPHPTEIESQLLVLGDFINWQKLKAREALAQADAVKGDG